LAKNAFERSRYFFEKSLEAHTFYSLKLHEHQDPSKYNTTFIQSIYTDDKKDAGLVYGKDMNKVSKKITPKEMDDHLVTNAARVGRKVKRSTYRVINAVSFGKWNYEYHAPELHMKDDAEISPELQKGEVFSPVISPVLQKKDDKLINIGIS